MKLIWIVILGAVIAGCATVTPTQTFKKSPFPNRGVLVKLTNTDPAATVYCAGATGHVLIGAGPAYVDCGAAPPVTCIPPQVLENGVCITPPSCPCACTPPAIWNGTTCTTPPPVTCTPPQVLENGVCVTPPPANTGINSCAATQMSTVFPNGTSLPRQCSGNVTFYHNYHAPYPGPNLFRLDVALADAIHPGPFSDIISGYTMLLPVGAGSYVSLAFNMAISGQAQFTSDPSGGPAGMITISRRPGVFSTTDPDIVVSPVYGPCVYAYGASNSLWMGVGADCPLVMGTDYYLNFAPVQSDGTPLADYTGILSYSEVAGH